MESEVSEGVQEEMEMEELLAHLSASNAEVPAQTEMEMDAAVAAAAMGTAAMVPNLQEEVLNQQTLSV
jgi:hypothetical protein